MKPNAVSKAYKALIFPAIYPKPGFATEKRGNPDRKKI